MQAKITFYLKDKNLEHTTIYAAVHFLGKRYRIYTREKIEVEFWNQNTQKAKIGKQYTHGFNLNSRLDLWRNTIQKAIDNFSGEITPPHIDDLIKEVDSLKKGAQGSQEYILNWAEGFIPRSGRARETRKHYLTTLNLLKRFEKTYRTKLRFKDVDMQLYRNLKIWCEERNYSLNTFGGHVKNIKVFMNESNEELSHGHEGHRQPKFSAVSETADAIYLSEEELLNIHNLKIDWEIIMEYFPKLTSGQIKSKINSYNVIRDRFLIGCYTGLRVSDFTQLSNVNINDDFIRIKPVKGTGKNEDVIIPIHWVIRDIISRGFDWDKKVYNQKINQHIKHIAKMAKINETVSITRTMGGKQETNTFKKHELVTTHTARRSGATNMFKAGIPSLAIMKITGHKTEKSFLKYIKISQEENAEMLKDHPFFKR